MNKDRKIYGIDISKDVFDVYSQATGHEQFTNDSSGFASILKSLPKTALVLMEATGYYHY
jgi:transposase